MIVRCEEIEAANLPEYYLVDRLGGIRRGDVFDALAQGQRYVVYALLLRFGLPYFMVMDADGLFPIAYPAPLFAIEDARPSSTWRFHPRTRSDSDADYVFMAFEGWTTDPDFYYQLAEGQDIETFTSFRVMKKQIDDEAGFPTTPT